MMFSYKNTDSSHDRDYRGDHTSVASYNECKQHLAAARDFMKKLKLEFLLL